MGFFCRGEEEVEKEGYTLFWQRWETDETRGGTVPNLQALRECREDLNGTAG